jgi:hypothetical protein
MILTSTSSSLILKMLLTAKTKNKKASGITSEFWDTQEDRTTCENDPRRS